MHSYVAHGVCAPQNSSFLRVSVLNVETQNIHKLFAIQDVGKVCVWNAFSWLGTPPLPSVYLSRRDIDHCK